MVALGLVGGRAVLLQACTWQLAQRHEVAYAHAPFLHTIFTLLHLLPHPLLPCCPHTLPTLLSLTLFLCGADAGVAVGSQAGDCAAERGTA